MKLTIFVLIYLKRVGLNLFGPFHKFFILDLHEYLDDGSVVKW